MLSEPLLRERPPGGPVVVVAWGDIPEKGLNRESRSSRFLAQVIASSPDTVGPRPRLCEKPYTRGMASFLAGPPCDVAGDGAARMIVSDRRDLT